MASARWRSPHMQSSRTIALGPSADYNPFRLSDDAVRWGQMNKSIHCTRGIRYCVLRLIASYNYFKALSPGRAFS
jgi:hypothetical protein